MNYQDMAETVKYGSIKAGMAAIVAHIQTLGGEAGPVNDVAGAEADKALEARLASLETAVGIEPAGDAPEAEADAPEVDADAPDADAPDAPNADADPAAG